MRIVLNLYKEIWCKYCGRCAHVHLVGRSIPKICDQVNPCWFRYDINIHIYIYIIQAWFLLNIYFKSHRLGILNYFKRMFENKIWNSPFRLLTIPNICNITKRNRDPRLIRQQKQMSTMWEISNENRAANHGKWKSTTWIWREIGMVAQCYLWTMADS